MSSNNKSKIKPEGGQHCDVFTLPYVVAFMLDLVGYKSDRDLSRISILEPSCGDGEFVVEILNRLYASSLKFGFDFLTAVKANVFAADINEGSMNKCILRIRNKYNLNRDILDNFFVEDFLLSSHRAVDIVIGNPPYIRYENIPKESLGIYKSMFKTFYYRSDIYIPFYEKSLSLLKPGGKLCFICSNRWLKNTYGKRLRELVSEDYSLDAVYNMEGVSAFQEAVLAYPSITLISNEKKMSPTAHFQVRGSDASDLGAIVETVDDRVNASSAGINALTNLRTIEGQGFRIGIGVATGNDKLYVSQHFKGVIEDSLLLPCINARNLKGDELCWDKRYLIDPYDNAGHLINLDRFPLAKDYFLSHKDELSKRHKAQKNPQRWYATIDRIDRNLIREPKILLPDISGNKFIFVDEGNFYPQHNIYYITGGSTRSLKLLAAILMSASIRQQLDLLTNHMNGGYARWQSQYLRNLRVPTISKISDGDAETLIAKYEAKDYQAVNEVVDQIVQKQTSNVHRSKESHSYVRQLSFNF